MEKYGNITIIESESRFKKIDKSLIENHNIDCLTLGIYAKLIVLGKKWQLNIKGLRQHLGISDEKVRKSLSLLEREGYILRTPVRNEKGQLVGWNYTIYPTPINEDDRSRAGVKKQQTRDDEIPTPPKTDHSDNGGDNNNRLNEQIDLTEKETELNFNYEKDADFLDILPKEDKPKRKPKAIKRSNWRGDYDEYKAIVEKACDELMKDEERKKKVLQLYPSADYQRTVIKWCQYWSSEEGWNNKKKGTTNTINMFNTFDKTFQYSIIAVNNTISSTPPRKEVIQDGEWADGTYVLGGYRYYDSPKTGQRTSVAMNAPARPNEWAEYDYKNNNWITPIEHDNGIFW